mgnify:CR=1 FL=1
MMGGWKEYSLGKLAPYFTGKINASSLNSENYISADNMLPDRNGIVLSDYLPNNGKVTKYEANDILVSNIRPYFKKIWFANSSGGCSNDVIVFRTNSELADPTFVYYQLSKDDFFDFMMAGANGTKMPRGNKKAIPEYKINLPPLPTQRRIASILSAYDDLIENNLKRIKLLEEMAQITYEKWFVRMKFPGHETAVFDEETGLPEGWRKVKLGEVCELTMGQSPKSEYYNSEKKGLPFHQGVKDYGDRFPTNTMWSTNGNRIADKGTVLFSVRAPVGRLNIALEKIILGRGLASISHKNNWNGFIYYQLKQIFFEDNLMGGGAIFNSVTKNDMLRIELIEGNNSVMERFNRVVKPIDTNIVNLHTQNQRLKEARDILLPRLMTGMIDVEKISEQYVSELKDKLVMAAEDGVEYVKERKI